MNSIYGVITGDIVNSTKMENKNLKSLMSSFSVFEQSYREKYSFKLDTFRGDSFQIITNKPDNIFSIVFLLRMWIMKQTPTDVRFEHIFDARFAIGFGTADTNVDNVRNMNGEAFINSGHTLDNMKRWERIKCLGYWDTDTNKTLEIYANTIAEIISGWTRKQIEVCFEYFTNEENRNIICEILNLKQASISQFLKLSHYRLIQQIILHSEKIINSHIC